jgi:hypothetical protein
VPSPKKEDHIPTIKAFIEKLVGLPSSLNRAKRFYTNFSCLKNLEDYGAASEELWIIASMTKTEQEPLYKEWINARKHTGAGIGQGYGLRIGPEKK